MHLEWRMEPGPPPTMSSTAGAEMSGGGQEAAHCSLPWGLLRPSGWELMWEGRAVQRGLVSLLLGALC